MFSSLFSHSSLVRIEYSQNIIDVYMDFKIHDPKPAHTQLPLGFAIDNSTERQRQRPQEGAPQKEHYSGKVIYLRPTAGEETRQEGSRGG
ncbi:MAG TPA: hypothetical protein VI935_06180 [Thermodesulfobacteriota bacterium]|nr:hypothetical protein [Thermodesulfobacteriota bacterium]